MHLQRLFITAALDSALLAELIVSASYTERAGAVRLFVHPSVTRQCYAEAAEPIVSPSVP